MLKGHTAPEVAQVQRQAYALCQQSGDSPQLFSALVGLWGLSLDQAQYATARELGEQCFALAQRLQEPPFLQEAHLTLGATLFYTGEFVARTRTSNKRWRSTMPGKTARWRWGARQTLGS